MTVTATAGRPRVFAGGIDDEEYERWAAAEGRQLAADMSAAARAAPACDDEVGARALAHASIPARVRVRDQVRAYSRTECLSI